MLNIKGVRVRSSSEKPVTALHSRRGGGVVTARDIDLPAGVELVNPDHYIAYLDSDDARLEVELTIERGRGYLSADQRDMVPIGEIPVQNTYHGDKAWRLGQSIAIPPTTGKHDVYLKFVHKDPNSHMITVPDDNAYITSFFFEI